MTEIQQNRWDQLVRRVANIVGGGSQVNDTLNELFPTIDVENVPIELLALSGMNIATGGTLLNPSVADINKHQLFNPVGSGALLVVTTMIVSTGVAGNAELDIRIGPLADSAGNVIRRDTRTGVLGTSVAQNRSEQSATGVAPHFKLRLLANTPFTLQDQNGLFVLFPGTGLTFGPTTVNVQSVCQFLWRERLFEPAEVNF